MSSLQKRTRKVARPYQGPKTPLEQHQLAMGQLIAQTRAKGEIRRPWRSDRAEQLDQAIFDMTHPEHDYETELLWLRLWAVDEALQEIAGL